MEGRAAGVVHELHTAMRDRQSEIRDVEADLDDVCGHLNAQHGRLVDIAVWLLAHPTHWTGDGTWTPEQYLTWRCGISHATASKIVTIARRADELPDTVAALRAGELSLDQALPIAKRVPSWADTRVAHLATRLTVRQIQRTVSEYPFHHEPDADPDAGSAHAAAAADGDDATHDCSAGDGDTTDAGVTDFATSDAGVSDSDTTDSGTTDSGTTDSSTTDSGASDGGTTDGDVGGPADVDSIGGSGVPGAERGRSAAVEPEDRCWWGVGDDGRWRLHVETSRDLGDVIGAALDEARDALFRRTGEPAGGLDALTEVAQRSLDAVDTPARRERHRVLVHLHTDGTATDHTGIALPDTLRRHLTCDGTLTPVFVESGMPVSVGRTERIVPERTRRIVVHRDGGCRVPGCHHRHHLEIHHIVHWTDGGPTDTWNLVALCAHHHRLHHHGKLGITGDADRPDGLVFTRADGTPIRPSGASPNPPSGPPPPIAGTYHHPLGERLDTRYVDFHPPLHAPPYPPLRPVDDPPVPRRPHSQQRSAAS